MQVFHGAIVTCDESNHVFKYLVESNGKIEFVGNNLPLKYQNFPIFELKNQALLPSFGDGHIHFTNWALIASAYFDVRTAKKFADYGTIIHNFLAQHPKAKIVAGFGASQHSVEEERLITRTELDEFCQEIPLILIGYDGHSLLANTMMIEKFPDEVKKQRGFYEEEGHLFNEAYYKGLDFATSMISSLTMIKSIIKGYDLAAQYGVGMLHSVEGIGFPKDLDVTLAMMIAKAQSHRSRFQNRIFFQTMDIDKVKKKKLPRIGGCFATALDGCFGACDAALTEPYTHDPKNSGILFYSDEQVQEFVNNAHRRGLQIEMHAIGDAAVKQAVQALSNAIEAYPRENHRHTIIHACLISDADLQKCVKFGIGITLQPGFLVSPLEPKAYLERILGNRVKKSSPLKKMIETGIHLSGGSDGPVTHPNPIQGIFGACNHPYDPSQSLTIPEALRMYTYEVAWTSFDEQERGSLEEGKIADMVILNRNPLDLSPQQLMDLKVEQLILHGIPYSSGMGLIGMLWHYLLAKKVKI